MGKGGQTVLARHKPTKRATDKDVRDSEDAIKKFSEV